MKLRSIFCSLFFGLTVFSNAQGDSDPGKELSLIIGPSFNTIKNNNISVDPYADTRGSSGVNGGFNYCRYFTSNVGLVFGAEYSSFKNTTTYRGFYKKDETSTDADGYEYYPVAEVDYKDVRKVSTIDIPLALRLQYKKESAAVFLDLGFKLNLTLSSKFTETGTAASKGLYPNPNYANVFLLIQDDAYYHFSTVHYTKNEDMRANRANYSFVVGGGVKAPIVFCW